MPDFFQVTFAQNPQYLASRFLHTGKDKLLNSASSRVWHYIIERSQLNESKYCRTLYRSNIFEFFLILGFRPEITFLILSLHMHTWIRSGYSDRWDDKDKV